MKQPISFNCQFGPLIAAALLFCSSAFAEVLGVQNINDFPKLGYVSMGRLNASLLYPALTDKPYDTKLVVYKNQRDFPQSYSPKIDELMSNDEFTAQAALKVFQPILDKRIDEIKSARGYVVPLNVTLGGYDFTANRFPLGIKMITDDPKSNRTYTCGWEFKRVGRLNLGACVGAKNWTKNDTTFRYLRMSEAQGQELKNRFRAGTLAFYFIMEPTGKFQIVTDPKLRYFSDETFTVINVAGLQEANVIEFIVADKVSGDILIAGPMPGSRISDNMAKSEPAANALGANNRPATTPDGEKNGGVSVDVPPAQPPSVPVGIAPRLPGVTPLNAEQSTGAIQAGMPTDSVTYDLDKFLSQVAYAVYSDEKQLDETRASLQEAQNLLSVVENDPLRSALIRAKEIKDTKATIEAFTQKLNELQKQGDIKRNVGTAFGARQLSYPAIEAYAASKRIYFDSYLTRDGKFVVVFRGSANNGDVITDLKIGMTPELFTELATRAKVASKSPMVSGVSDLVIKNMSTGQFNSKDTGMPEEFRAAEEIIARLLSTGVRAADMVITGHSLGGGYAQYVGMRKKVGQVVAFNPAPLSAQLQKQAISGLGSASVRIRHYISFISANGNGAADYYDPVSQLASEFLKQPELNSLRVIGEQYVVRVCASTNSPEYDAFNKKAQDYITKKTLSKLGKKEGEKTKKAGKWLGGLDGAVNSTDERMNSYKTGKEVGEVPGKVFGSAAYCIKHPYKCGGKVVLGGLASAIASSELPRMWLILNAHKMKNMAESMQQGGMASCP